MLDRALSRTFANLSTLVLVAFVFALPIHLVQAYLFRDLLAVQELRPEIAALPEGRLVRGVDEGDFQAERAAFLIAVGIDLLLMPFAYRAAKRVMEVDGTSGVPGVIDAWTNLGSASPPPIGPGPVLVTAALAVAAATGLLMIGNLIGDMASADFAWAVFALARGSAMALFVGILAGVGAAIAADAGGALKPVEKIDLY